MHRTDQKLTTLAIRLIIIYYVSTIEPYNNRGCVIYSVRVCIPHYYVFKIVVSRLQRQNLFMAFKRVPRC